MRYQGKQIGPTVEISEVERVDIEDNEAVSVFDLSPLLAHLILRGYWLCQNV
jgi:hypothetical protein